MRAVVVHAFGPIDAHAVEDFPDPEPGPGDVLIDVHAAGVNFSDTLIVQERYQLRPDVPFEPGRDVAGVIAAVRTPDNGALAVARFTDHDVQGKLVLLTGREFKAAANGAVNYTKGH